MGPYAGSNYNLTICALQSRLQHIYQSRPEPYAGVDLFPSQGLWVWPSVYTSPIYVQSIPTPPSPTFKCPSADYVLTAHSDNFGNLLRLLALPSSMQQTNRIAADCFEV
jgi:hypothetical protein